MLGSAAKGREVTKKKERSQFPHGHLVFFILLPSSSTIHLEITAGVAMVVHTNILLLCLNIRLGPATVWERSPRSFPELTFPLFGEERRPDARERWKSSLPEHSLCIKEAKLQGDVGLREVHSLVACTCG